MFETSLNEIKKELKQRSADELIEMCLLLSKYKKDNKDYLGYLLFDREAKGEYVRQVLLSIDQQFDDIREQKHWYALKKSWRKILRHIAKCAKFSKSKEHEIQFIIHFVACAQNSGVPYYAFQALNNIVELQFKKIRQIIPHLHEDLQHDYQNELTQLLDKDTWTS